MHACEMPNLYDFYDGQFILYAIMSLGSWQALFQYAIIVSTVYSPTTTYLPSD